MTFDKNQLQEDKKLSVAVFAIMIGFPLAIAVGGWAGYELIGGMFGFIIGVFVFVFGAWLLFSIRWPKSG